jgi:4-hydroxy-tetrahydrodipicolinate reductase
MIHAVVTGASGRMGSRIIHAVRDTDGIALVGATERAGNQAVGLDAGLAAGIGPLEVMVQDSLMKALARADVVIDFTNAKASVEHARICAERGVAAVIGSTGMSADDKAAIRACAEKAPIVMAPNMSVGVTLMIKLVQQVAQTFGPEYEVEVVELHHNQKKDAPSGTALRLAEVAAQALGYEAGRDVVYERRGDIGERPQRQIGVQTVRGGDVVGEHTVFFFGKGERLEITHRATSREQFARGAVRAATWVVGRAPGLYDMMDVLGLR